MYTMKGRSTSVTTGFAMREVSGRSRVPLPPARITACMTRSSDPNPLVGQSRGADRCGVQRVAPVDHDTAGHRGGNSLPLEREELGPLGDEHDRVRTGDDVLDAIRVVQLGHDLASFVRGEPPAQTTASG